MGARFSAVIIAAAMAAVRSCTARVQAFTAHNATGGKLRHSISATSKCHL